MHKGVVSFVIVLTGENSRQSAQSRNSLLCAHKVHACILVLEEWVGKHFSSEEMSFNRPAAYEIMFITITIS